MRGCAVSSNGIFLFRTEDGKEEGEKLGICSASLFGSKIVPNLEMNFPLQFFKKKIVTQNLLPSRTYVN